MGFESQGVLIRRESTVAGTTASLAAQTDIGFTDDGTAITRQAGFAGFDVGMRIKSNATANNGVWTVKGGTADTALTVQEPISSQASGQTITLTGHTMQNIGQVVSFNGPSITANPIDVTDLTATAKEKLIGVYDGGPVSISVILDNEASNANLHLELAADMRARTVRCFDIVFTEPATQPSAVFWQGYISAFNITGAVDNALKADITFAVSTEVNFIKRV